MGIQYAHLNIEERCQMARLHSEGYSLRQIAATLDRTPSTISRELKRNGSKTLGYQPTYADKQARARRWRGSKLERYPDLRDLVLTRLEQGWSPQQVAGRLARDKAKRRVSHETIYRFIYAQMARKKDYSWRHYLPQTRSKHGRRRYRGRSPASFITLRRALSQRPGEVAKRQTPGHWEADLMLFRKHGQAVVTLHERHSRLVLATRMAGKAATPTAEAMKRLLAGLPPAWRQTVTFDNATEFARHYRLHGLGVETFFCDAHAPWQKGGVENAIGRMRRVLPRKTDLAVLPKWRFRELVQAYNNTPRKCLGYQTPAEVFWNHVLHLKCESTLPPARE